MADRDFIPLVADLVKESENYRDILSADRIKATEYYDGIMKDTPSDKGRSSVVSRDVREQIQKVLPALTRVFLSSSQIVEFQPVSMGDEEQAEQASDYISNVVLPESDGEQVITDALHDALKLRNAALAWRYDERTDVRVSRHTGLDDMSYSQMVAEEGVELLEHTARQETVEGPQGPELSLVHDFKIRRKVVERKPVLECLPLEELLVHPDALTEDEAPLIGRKTRVRRTDLVAMGYDKAVVDALPIYGADGQNDEAEELSRREFIETGHQQVAHELQEVDYYELYVRLDIDGDGIAELRRMCFGGKVTATGLLHNEEADDVPYALLAVKSKPHQWEGVSLFDDVQDIQRIKTVLLRNTLDNLYWQNNPQIAMARDAVENPDAVTNPQFGQVVWLNEGRSVAEAMQPIVIPFVAEKSFGMLEYLDGEKADRTGVTDASGGLAPDALQNTTAKASAMIEAQGIGQAELMARTFAIGLRRAFRGLLRLIVKHQDKPRIVRLRNQWVTFDPRQWNADMDCVVNTGLGAGTRERDMMALMNMLQLQKEVIGVFGPGNMYVTPDQFGTTLQKLAEAAGFKSPHMFFTKPTPEQIQQQAEAAANQPNPEMVKAEAEANLQRELKAMDLQHQAALKQMDVQAATQKETVQSRAAVEEKVAIAQIEARDKEKDRDLKRYEIDQRTLVDLVKLDAQQRFDAEREEMRTSREDTRHFAALGMEVGEDGKPYDKVNKSYEDTLSRLVEAMSRPRKVRTPEGEEFIMEAFGPQVVN